MVELTVLKEVAVSEPAYAVEVRLVIATVPVKVSVNESELPSTMTLAASAAVKIIVSAALAVPVSESFDVIPTVSALVIVNAEAFVNPPVELVA
jgi:hypothetical protein